MVQKQSGQSSGALTVGQQKVLKLINEAIFGIDTEINAHKNGTGKDGTLSQLEIIRSEIEKMMSVMNPEAFVPYYPRVIVDSWDFNSKLGEKLIGLVHEYKKLSRR